MATDSALHSFFGLPNDIRKSFADTDRLADWRIFLSKACIFFSRVVYLKLTIRDPCFSVCFSCAPPSSSEESTSTISGFLVPVSKSLAVIPLLAFPVTWTTPYLSSLPTIIPVPSLSGLAFLFPFKTSIRLTAVFFFVSSITSSSTSIGSDWITST